MHIPDAKRRKLGDKSEPMILVGYHETGAYRLYHPLNHSIVIMLKFVRMKHGIGIRKRRVIVTQFPQ